MDAIQRCEEEIDVISISIDNKKIQKEENKMCKGFLATKEDFVRHRQSDMWQSSIVRIEQINENELNACGKFLFRFN